ncbi:alpha/beta hydrolase [Kribbella turkmenica]|uniref:Alpha/beta hydrolase n=2 Tax=Kribbella turkmenica TaxID=2530375 RepID=A0A4R4XBL7_9ACTN|nr:alpha/beta hydrolase [Kribbella turkmenica]
MADRTVASGRYDSPDEGVTTEDRVFEAADGQKIALRVYVPDHRSNRGAIYHVHGGGFIVGDLEMSHQLNVELAREVGSVVVSVGYRLAPEWPFPTPVEDVYGGLVWIHQQAGELGIDPSLVVLHGQSAGAGLVAAAALLARDRNGPPIRFQLLTSPTLDDRVVTPSSRLFTDTPALTRRDVEICWSAYLGPIERGSTAVSPYAAPGRATDLANLPRTYVSAAELDPLRDEAIAFAQALLAAGVSVELHVFPGTFHGSLAVRGAAISRRQLAEEIAVLTSVLGHTKSPDNEGVRDDD